jgi:hypothetical protein
MRPAEQQRMRRFRDAALEPMSARGPKQTFTRLSQMSPSCAPSKQRLPEIVSNCIVKVSLAIHQRQVRPPIRRLERQMLPSLHDEAGRRQE